MRPPHACPKNIWSHRPIYTRVPKAYAPRAERKGYDGYSLKGERAASRKPPLATLGARSAADLTPRYSPPPPISMVRLPLHCLHFSSAESAASQLRSVLN